MSDEARHTAEPDEADGGIVGMVLDKRPYTFDRVVRIVLTVAGFLIFLRALDYLSDVLIPFAIAFLLAYLINPLVVRIQKKVQHRAASVALALLAVFLFVAILLAVLVPVIVNEATHTAGVLGQLVDNSTLAKSAQERLPPDIWAAIKDFLKRDDIREMLQSDKFAAALEETLKKVLPGLWGVIAGSFRVVLGILGLFTIVLYLVFLLMDYQKAKDEWRDLIPPGYKEGVIAFIRDADAAMNRYFRGQAAIASIVGIIHAIGFWLIDLPMGVLMGLLIGLLNMVPYLQLLGMVPAFLLAMLHALETGSSFWWAIALTALVFGVAQVAQDGYLTPKIMGDATGLSPAMILLSLSIWGKLLGMLGLLIALPMTCILMAYYRRLLSSMQPAPEREEMPTAPS